MGIADVLSHLPVFGQKAADVSKPSRPAKGTARRPARPALRTYVPVAAESDAGHEKRLEFEAAERRILKACGRTCEACGAKGKAVTCHHRLARSQGGTNDDANLMPVCRPCHKRLHNSPAEAARAGHSRRRAGTGITKGTNH